MGDFDLQTWLRRAQVQGIKLGLDNVRAATDALGSPQSGFPSLLIGGTNGKGSVVAMSEAILRAQGLSVGATISPHLTEYRERIRIGGASIDQAGLDALGEHVASVLDPDPTCAGITFFELGVVLALMAFRQHAVDCAVIEVGMGGEFDATRVCGPLVAALVSIDLDHVRHLGPTVQDIARTKARVAEAGMPVVVGERREDRLAVVREELDAAGAQGIYAGRDFRLRPDGETFVFEGLGRTVDGITLNLQGLHQRSNAAVAVAAVLAFAERAALPPISNDAVRRGLATAFVPGRQEEAKLGGSGVRVLLDGAHNPAGARSLATTLLDRPSDRRIWLFASMKDKDRAAIYDHLLPHVDQVWCCKGASTPRYAEPDDLVEEIAARGVVAVNVGTPALGVHRAAGTLTEGEELLVAGSLYLVGDVRPLLITG